MKLDLDELAAEVARERDARVYRDSTPILTDHVREERLLADLICWPELLDEHEELEVDDFAHLKTNWLFGRMRTLNWRGEFTTEALFASFTDEDPFDALAFVVDIVLRYPTQLFERGRRETCAWLRELSQRRHQL